jgi:hypothetical protein
MGLVSAYLGFVIVVTVVGSLRVQPIVAQEIPADSLEQAVQDSMGVRTDCDTDVDGAMIGGVLGTIPLWLSFFGGQEDEQLTMVFLGFVGGIAGFWAGLAVDSLDCEDPRARETPERLQ